MKKAPMAVAFVLVFGLFASAYSLAPAVAQYTAPNSTSTGGTTDNTTSTAGTGNATGTDNQTSTADEGSTFSASGRIAGIIYDTPDSTSTETTSDSSSNMSYNSNMTSDGALTTGNTSAGNTTLSQVMTGGNDTSMSDNATDTATSSNATGTSTLDMNDTSTAQQDETELPYIVSGDWSLDVQDGSVSDFAANFTMVHTDGTGRHTHDVSNFEASNGSSIQLEQDGVTFIFGTSDIMTNGSTAWTGGDSLIVIENGNAASLTFSTEDDHFKGQPLYGIVDSLTDENGEELIQTQTAQEGAGGNATSTGATGNQTAGGNETGGFLGDIGETFQNMTGLGQ